MSIPILWTPSSLTKEIVRPFAAAPGVRLKVLPLLKQVPVSTTPPPESNPDVILFTSPYQVNLCFTGPDPTIANLLTKKRRSATALASCFGPQTLEALLRHLPKKRVLHVPAKTSSDYFQRLAQQEAEKEREGGDVIRRILYLAPTEAALSSTAAQRILCDGGVTDTQVIHMPVYRTVPVPFRVVMSMLKELVSDVLRPGSGRARIVIACASPKAVTLASKAWTQLLTCLPAAQRISVEVVCIGPSSAERARSSQVFSVVREVDEACLVTLAQLALKTAGGQVENSRP